MLGSVAIFLYGVKEDSIGAYLPRSFSPIW